MSDIAIRSEGLGKRYRIGVSAPPTIKLREAVSHLATAPLRNFARLRGLSRFRDADAPDILWALRDVSFTLKHGEVLGIVGHNGAGKSTLLKLLSQITRPTAGFADLYGRVGSLLEVGTGFHPELTGRDNIFLNGSILGMDRRYMKRRFSEIVEFSGVERFIDTPVKRYSSGMYVRLAFAVAAHLEPEILIVDEVLAVGDAEFQAKCLGKMGDVAREGRTVLFVSHNLGAVQRLCTRALLLHQGRSIADGPTSEVVRRYLATGAATKLAAGRWIAAEGSERSGSGDSRIESIRLSSGDPSLEMPAYPGGPLEIGLTVRADLAIPRFTLGFTLRDAYGATLISGSTNTGGVRLAHAGGVRAWRILLSSLPLRPGTYPLELWIGDQVSVHDRVARVAQVEVVDRPGPSLGSRHDPSCDGPMYCEYVFSSMPEENVAMLAPNPETREVEVVEARYRIEGTRV